MNIRYSTMMTLMTFAVLKMTAAIGIGFNVNLSMRINTISQMDNTTKDVNSLYQDIAASSAVYIVIATIMSIILLLGLLENFAVLYAFASSKTIRTVDNMLIAGLALSDFGQSIFGVPLVAIASICQRWIFGDFFCQYYAFITTSLGLSQITLLTFMAVERYYIIVRRARKFTNTYCKCITVIGACFLYGFAWATGPVIGWSSYEVEAIGIACSVRWEVQTVGSLSYTACLFIFGWILPLILVAFCYINIARLIHKQGNWRKRLHRTSERKDKINRETKVSVTILMMIGAFILSWAPYSVVSMWSAIYDIRLVPVWLQVAPAVFAKCSIVWNPIIYITRHHSYRQAIILSMPCLQQFKTQRSGTNNVTNVNSVDTEAHQKLLDVNKDNLETPSTLEKKIQLSSNYDLQQKVTTQSRQITQFNMKRNCQEDFSISYKGKKSHTKVVTFCVNDSLFTSPSRNFNSSSALPNPTQLEEIPETEVTISFNENFKNKSKKRRKPVRFITKYGNDWRCRLNLADKQTQCGDTSWSSARIQLAEKSIQTDVLGTTEILSDESPKGDTEFMKYPGIPSAANEFIEPTMKKSFLNDFQITKQLSRENINATTMNIPSNESTVEGMCNDECNTFAANYRGIYIPKTLCHKRVHRPGKDKMENQTSRFQNIYTDNTGPQGIGNSVNFFAGKDKIQAKHYFTDMLNDSNLLNILQHAPELRSHQGRSEDVGDFGDLPGLEMSTFYTNHLSNLHA